METFHLFDLARCSRGTIEAAACAIGLAQRQSNAFLQVPHPEWQAASWQRGPYHAFDTRETASHKPPHPLGDVVERGVHPPSSRCHYGGIAPADSSILLPSSSRRRACGCWRCSRVARRWTRWWSTRWRTTVPGAAPTRASACGARASWCNGCWGELFHGDLQRARTRSYAAGVVFSAKESVLEIRIIQLSHLPRRPQTSTTHYVTPGGEALLGPSHRAAAGGR
jgi:hypothetical protein